MCMNMHKREALAVHTSLLGYPAPPPTKFPSFYYSRGHRKIPVPFTLHDRATVITGLCPSPFRVYLRNVPFMCTLLRCKNLHLHWAIQAWPSVVLPFSVESPIVLPSTSSHRFFCLRRVADCPYVSVKESIAVITFCSKLSDPSRKQNEENSGIQWREQQKENSRAAIDRSFVHTLLVNKINFTVR